MTKTKVIAINTIIRTIEPGKPGDKNAGIAPTPPKTLEIEPGSHFMLDSDDDEYKDLKAAQAIRDYTKADAAAFALFTNVLDSDPAGTGDADAAETASVKTTEKTTKAKSSKKAAETGTTEGDDEDGKGLV